MHSQAKLSCASEILVFRERYCEEMNCQIVHDSIHRRAGWTLTYVLELDAISVGFGSIAIGGPWKDRPTLFEFYILPQYRSFSFDLLRNTPFRQRAAIHGDSIQRSIAHRHVAHVCA